MLSRLASVIWLLVFSFALPAFSFQLKMASNSLSSLHLELGLEDADLAMTEVRENEQTFSRLPQHGTFHMKDAGSPELLQLHRWLAVAKGVHYTVHYDLSDEVTLHNVLLFPSQPDHLEGQRVAFTQKDSVYESDEWLGTPVTVGKTSQLGDVTILPLTLTPMRYNPAQRELTVYRKVSVTLTADEASARDSYRGSSPSVFALSQASALTLNGKEFAQMFLSRGKTTRLLIVSTASLMPFAKQLGALNEESGTTVSYLEVKSGVSSHELKDAIASEYHKSPLDSVLLFGGIHQLPVSYLSGIPGDFDYSLLSGNDEIADISIGRLPVTNEVQAQLLVNKEKRYRELKAANQLNKKIMLIANSEEYPGKYTANQEVIRKAANPRDFEYVTQYGGDDANNNTLIENANQGFGIINYRGHGSHTSWASWGNDGRSFTLSDVDKLKDSDTDMAFFFNVACDNGSIQESGTSLVEKELMPSTTTKYKGAIGAFGATQPSWTEVNDRFDINLFQYLETSDDLSIGNIFTLANNKLTQDNGGSAPDNVKMYILFSNPRLIPRVN